MKTVTVFYDICVLVTAVPRLETIKNISQTKFHFTDLTKGFCPGKVVCDYLKD